MKEEKDSSAGLIGHVASPKAESEPRLNRFTPGPWRPKRAEVRVDGEYDYAIVAGANQVIAEAFGRTSPSDFPPAEANAHLIAAAPDLYEALKRAVADADGAANPSSRLPNYNQAVAALQKANGR